MNEITAAELLFPHITKNPADFEKIYPPRELPPGAKVTRLGPSPTGFIHLGNLYGAIVDERLAHQSGGCFYLRIEDTDKKRFVEGAVASITETLKFFNISFDEGAGIDCDIGNYGPYFQSRRVELYQTFVKALIHRGDAYPCFMTETELQEMRTYCEAAGETPGIYGDYAKYRDLSVEEVKALIYEGKPYVIRLRSSGNPTKPVTISIDDGIRGTLTMPENFQDVVILKADGIPTYHFAHVCDDHFMRTTHVVRGEEWLSSLPIHLELFSKLGFIPPVYCHTAVLMKSSENGNRRKLSKRKDPELSLDFYREKGYHPDAMGEYLLTILNSNYEEWRRNNPNLPKESFPFSTEKMSTSGTLFDLNKLNDISKDTLVRIPAKTLYDFLLSWAKSYRKDLLPLLDGRKDFICKILDLGRGHAKPRKDLIYAEQIFNFISYFFDETFAIVDDMPEEIRSNDVKAVLNAYMRTYCHADDQETWFGKIRELATQLGYAAKPKDYKKNPGDYKGHVGHISTAIRIALTGRAQSPDIREIQQILGEEKTINRLEKYLTK